MVLLAVSLAFFQPPTVAVLTLEAQVAGTQQALVSFADFLE